MLKFFNHEGFNFLFLFGLIFLFSPTLLEACSVCFGGTDGELRRGFFWGILFLGALPLLLVASFVGTLFRNAKKNQIQKGG